MTEKKAFSCQGADCPQFLLLQKDITYLFEDIQQSSEALKESAETIQKISTSVEVMAEVIKDQNRRLEEGNNKFCSVKSQLDGLSKELVEVKSSQTPSKKTPVIAGGGIAAVVIALAEALRYFFKR